MNNWKKIKIEEVCSFINGYAFDSNKYVQNGIQVIRITNVQKGYISDTDKKFYKEEKELERYKLIEDDLLISLTGNVGRVGVIKSENLPAYLNQRVSCVRIKNNNLLNKRFLFNFLNSDSFEKTCIKNSKGIAQKNISTVWLREIKIPLPPMEEQKKIAARLDAVSDLLAKQKQLLSEQDNLIQSTFYDMFLKQNFSKRKIVDFVETDVKNAKKIFNKNNFIKYIDISSIDNNSNIITGYTHIEFCDAPSRAQQVVKKNDILVSTVRPNLKNIALIKFNDNNLVASSGFCVLRAKNIEPVFLLYNVLSQDFTEKMVSAVTGANYPAIKNSDILNYKIPVPPLELQEKFAAVAEQIESEKSKIKSAIAETQTLFNALMSEYFEE